MSKGKLFELLLCIAGGNKYGWNRERNAEVSIAAANAEPELRALLAERDSLREQEKQIKQFADDLCKPASDEHAKVVAAVRQSAGKELQSILNATLSEGERR
jgi:hypothetical protein